MIRHCPVKVLADRMGIEIVVGHHSRRVRRRRIGEWFYGPQGGAYNPSKRSVMIASDHDYAGGDDARVQHEISHLVCAVPFADHNRVPEELFLLQWEGLVAKEIGIDPSHYAFYRGTTRLRLFRNRRFHSTGVLRSKIWKEGFDRAHRLGLLEGNQVTWKWPDWSRLSIEDWRLLHRW